ncbi:hypothetical protein [Halosimplex halophilum]|nr:hypothetical protein [Halosimplex halophilum]
MSAHCHCDDRQPRRVETEITHGAPEGTTAVRIECANCWGLIRVVS